MASAFLQFPKIHITGKSKELSLSESTMELREGRKVESTPSRKSNHKPKLALMNSAVDNKQRTRNKHNGFVVLSSLLSFALFLASLAADKPNEDESNVSLGDNLLKKESESEATDKCPVSETTVFLPVPQLSKVIRNKFNWNVAR